LKEERTLILFDNRVLRTIFEVKREIVTGGWGKMA
jgi:hypothetical protein